MLNVSPREPARDFATLAAWIMRPTMVGEQLTRPELYDPVAGTIDSQG